MSAGKSIHRIFHIADIHVRLFKRAEEYRLAFERLDADFRAANIGSNDLIVIAGDISHTKSDTSPEMIELITDLFRKMTALAPTIVIAGNHDFSQNSRNRLDVLTPIVDALQLPNLHYLKHSGITRFGDIDVAVMSILDDPVVWPIANDCSASTKIALFHGPIYSAKTDVGYEITSRHHEVSMFDGFDMALLGDIHSPQTLQLYDAANVKPIVTYCGSLVQQNHGESPSGHGWYEWNVKTRTPTFHELPNDYGYYTIRVQGKILPDIRDMPKNVRLRLFTGELDESEIKTYITELRTKYNVVECSVTRPHTTRYQQLTTGTNLLDVGDVGFQNTLITDWVRTHVVGITDDIITKVVDINTQLNSEILKDDLARKIVWIPKTLTFDNLFTYGEGNTINFESLQGVVGLFGENAKGKSSIPDAICFALYDRTPRTTLSANFINTRKTTCFVEFIFMIGDTEFGITRRGKRSTKGDVKIDVDFWMTPSNGEMVSLNGDKRQETNAVIRQYVGDFDDFLLTAFSVQDKNSLFIDRGQSDRKDVLNQFMGLKIFELLFEEAKEQSKSVAAILRQFAHEDFTSDLANTQQNISNISELLNTAHDMSIVNTTVIMQCDTALQVLYDQRIPVTNPEQSIENAQYIIASAYKKLEETVVVRTELQTLIDGGPVVDITDLETELTKLHTYIIKGTEAVAVTSAWIENQTPHISNVQTQLSKFETQLADVIVNKKLLTQQQMTYKATISVLDTYDYDPLCTYCCTNQFVVEAKKAEPKLTAVVQELVALERKLLELTHSITMLGDVAGSIREWSNKKDVLNIQTVKLAQLQTRVSAIDGEKQKRILQADRQLQEHKNKLATQNDANKNAVATIDAMEKIIVLHAEQAHAVAHNAALLDDIIDLKTRKTVAVAAKSGVEKEIRQHMADIAVANAALQLMTDKIAQAQQLETDHKAYTAYLEAVGRNGVPYQLVSEIIPQVELDINNLLAPMVEFAVTLDVDGKNINASIVYDEDRIWPLELASGMEKFITGLAIRIALMGVSSLPKSNFLIIDEGFGALDSDMYNSLSMLFTMLKTQFDFILLISHMETLRDATDMIIDISRSDGYSQMIVA